MFSVFLAQLDDSCQRLYRIVLKLNFDIQRIERVMHELNSLSGMDIAKRQLRREKEKLEEQTQSMLQMLRGLEKVRMSYSMAERRILENGEGNRVRVIYGYSLESFSVFDKLYLNNVYPSIMI